MWRARFESRVSLLLSWSNGPVEIPRELTGPGEVEFEEGKEWKSSFVSVRIHRG